MIDRLRVVVVGASGHAGRVAVPALHRSSNAVLVGIVGSSAETARRLAQAHSVRAYADLEEALGDPRVEALWIASPNHLHEPIAVAGARAGKHLLIEKPLATTLAGAWAILEAVEGSHVVARVGYQHRFRAAHQRLRRLLVDEAIVGAIGLFRIHRFWRFPYFDDDPAAATLSDWRRSAESSGGWVTNDIGSHLLDLTPWVTGMPVSAAGGVMATQRFEVSTEDTALMVLQLGDKAVATLEVSAALESPGSRIEVYGQGGWIRVENSFGQKTRIESSAAHDEEYDVDDWLDPYVAQVENFAKVVRTETADIGTTLAEAADSVATVDELRSRSLFLR